MKHFDHVLSSTRTHIKNCIIEEFFVKPLVLDLKVAFEYCVFEVPIKLSGRQFNHEVTFLYCNITSITDFSDSQFYKDVLFCKTSFQDKVYFNNASFMQMLMIYENDFAKNLSFYQATFANLPLMVSSDLGGNINLLDTRLLFDFDDIKEKIQEVKFKFFIPDIFKKVLSLNSGDIFAFRDSFRLFKNALIKEGNNLDASNYHRLELYCKEIELDSKNPKIFSKDWIDKWQLFFYRLTSDHHTDLAKIFNNVILLIALFGIYSCALWGFKSTETITQEGNFDIVKIFSESSFLLSKLPSSPSIETKIISYILVLCSVISSFFIIKHMLSKITPHFDMRYLYLGVFWLGCALFFSHSQEAVLILILCLSFVISYLVLLIKNNKWLMGISYIVSLGILVSKPSLLLPFVGKFFDESLKVNFPAMQSLSVVYCILMFLMLFSLQKTARKNSIIPS